MKKIYVALLGRNPSDNLMEKHKIVYVIAENDDEAKVLAKEKWIAEKVHVDGVKSIEEIDGYKISVHNKEL